MNNQYDITKFEFLFSLENNIVVQRFFNVKDHNPQSLHSMDLVECVKNICDEICDNLKEKTFDYLCENQDYIVNNENVDNEVIDQSQHFLLELKLNDHVFISRTFPAYYYHPKVRYTVDIRPILKRILSDLTEVLSSEELELTYLNYQL